MRTTTSPTNTTVTATDPGHPQAMKRRGQSSKPATQPTPAARPVLLVLAGVNGAGKSSIGGNVMLRRAGLSWFNPDTYTRVLSSAGLPLNDASRLRAESWNASRVTLLEEQCRVHVSPYIYRGPLDLRIWTEKDPDTQRVLAIKNYISTWSQTRTIWMDGRPHPAANAPHTWMGFSTGEWHGDILTVHTSHIKYGWVRRNGVVQTDQATMTEHFIRHGDYMTHVMILEDPAYLTEPLIKTEDFAANLHAAGASWVYNCRPVKEIVSRDETKIPHYLPGENPFLGDLTKAFGIPGNALRGGAETMYPEYRLRMPRTPNTVTPALRVVPAAGPRL